MNWKNGLTALAVVLAGVGMVSAPMDVEAKRLGGGRASGMQRQMPAKQPSATPDATPNQAVKPGQQANAAPAQPAAPAAQPGKRSWLGPIAGIAAGLGIAALMSHLGMGEAFGNFLTMALLAVVAFMVIGWLMRRFKGAAPAAGPQLAGAGAPYPSQSVPQPASPMYREAVAQPSANLASGGAAAATEMPAGFDAAGFTRTAKMIFIRMQAANDAGNIDDLRKFTTPELFASLRLDIQERGQAANQTDVMQLDAELVDTAKEGGQWVATVRFHGLIREEVNAGAEPFNELWHLVRPVDESQDWAIAGITPIAA
ncbi:MAG TPA: TIM44-like domain-containing protein [Aquabacterium sp.]|uniref:Tim44 domain-containing protein n=1 Tax=Aquabacterium sp. TaxID=1872578 RepID=UPI002E30E195|nr:TIM44-like domain-containing protein [Aquabacterium sp.]HEX5355336.1 TIM44-like domain-containing protein [Aquabacterium sp.]